MSFNGTEFFSDYQLAEALGRHGGRWGKDKEDSSPMVTEIARTGIETLCSVNTILETGLGITATSEGVVQT